VTGLKSRHAITASRRSLLKTPTPRWKVLRYQQKEVNRSLRGVNSTSIGVIIPNLYDPFFVTWAHAISTVAGQHGHSVILAMSDENSDMEQKQTSLMLRHRVDGLGVIPASRNNRHYSGNAFSSVHVVTLDRPTPGSRFDSVLVPNRSGAKTAVEHLLSHGHRSIAFLGLNRTLYTMKTRYAGYREAMTNAGHSPAPYIDCGSPELAETLVRSMMKSQSPPKALLAANSLTMCYILHSLSAARIHVPSQIAVAGFDDFEMADVLQPSLTVIRQPVYKLGEVAANLLFQRILGCEVPKARHRAVLPLELVVRSSCGCHPRVANGRSEQDSSLTVSADGAPAPPQF
jgi:LacI family transcriptional regulator